MAASGEGDGAELAAEERARWRGEAITWLRTELALWEKRIANGSEGQRREAREALAYWQGDCWLESIREKAALAQLPPAERAEWEQVWKTVSQLFERARQSGRPKDQPKP
jgi:hypothetical protein